MIKAPRMAGTHTGGTHTGTHTRNSPTMDIRALINNSNIHSSPCAQRFYQLQVQQQAQDSIRHGPVLRGLRHSTPLSRDEKIEIRTLRNDAKWSYLAIAQATGKTVHQVQDALTGPLTPRKNPGRPKLVIKTPGKNTLLQSLHADPMKGKGRESGVKSEVKSGVKSGVKSQESKVRGQK